MYSRGAFGREIQTISERTGLSPAILKAAAIDFPTFMKHIFILSYAKYIPAKHALFWAYLIQLYRHTVKLASRGHMKSVTLYAKCMWGIYRCYIFHIRWEVDYFSYSKSLAANHTRKIKDCIRDNPVFFFANEVKGSAKSDTILRYSWPNGGRYLCTPRGILSASRGLHQDELMADDILLDPTEKLDPTIIKKIGRRFREVLMSMPDPDHGELHLIGTPQHEEDIFYWLRKNAADYHWSDWTAIVNEAKKTVLWPERFPYERLMRIKNNIGDKAFRQEYMLSPVWTEDAYFKRAEILACIDPEMRPTPRYKGHNNIYAAWDVGKKAHPSHLCVYEQLNSGHLKELMSIWFEVGTEYHDQIKDAKMWAKLQKWDICCFDNTRSELEGFWERNSWKEAALPQSIFVPVIMNNKMKFRTAAQLAKYIIGEDGKPNVTMLPDQRQLNLMLTVRNDLKALETKDGHGDSFMSHLLLMDAIVKSTSGDGGTLDL